MMPNQQILSAPAVRALQAPPEKVNPYQNGAASWFFKKYWWISIPVAMAIAGRVMERKREKTLTAYNVLEDISTIAAPGLGVLGVIALVKQEHSDALFAADERAEAEQAVEGVCNGC